MQEYWVIRFSTGEPKFRKRVYYFSSCATFLLNRILGVIKRKENTKKVGVEKFIFVVNLILGRISFEPK